jgi:hypothetical protein
VRRLRAAAVAGVDCGVGRVVALRGGLGGGADDAGFHRVELGGVAGFVDDAEPDVSQGAGELPGSEQLGGAGVDDRGVECLGQPLLGRRADGVASGAGLRPGGGYELVDESVPAQCELAESAAVAGHVRLAQLFAEVGELHDAVGVGADEQVGEPGRECRFA